jgi:hypothetical protein
LSILAVSDGAGSASLSRGAQNCLDSVISYFEEKNSEEYLRFLFY